MPFGLAASAWHEHGMSMAWPRVPAHGMNGHDSCMAVGLPKPCRCRLHAMFRHAMCVVRCSCHAMPARGAVGAMAWCPLRGPCHAMQMPMRIVCSSCHAMPAVHFTLLSMT